MISCELNSPYIGTQTSTIQSPRSNHLVVFKMSAYQLRLQKAEARISRSRSSSSSTSSHGQGFDWIKDAYAFHPSVSFDDRNKQPDSLNSPSHPVTQEEFDWIKTNYDFDTFMPSD